MDERLRFTFMITNLVGTSPKAAGAAIERLRKDEMLLSMRDISHQLIEARFWNANGGIIIHRIMLPPRVRRSHYVGSDSKHSAW